MKRILILISLLFWTFTSFAQNDLRQTVRGTVTSADPNTELFNASIVVKNSDPLIGATIDERGEFSMNVPIGRQTIEVRCVGFTTQTLEVLVTSGREVVLELTMEPSSIALEEVSIVAPYDKSKPINKLSYAGARSFSTEETYRFAGSLGDPARMVRNFAGVMPVNDSRNDIVIRGNSPVGVQWVLDGVEIANPNHFNAGVGMTGGQVSFLNTNFLSNSDFHLSAWPAPYGNAMSGIFDLNMRSGNNQKREYWFQMGYGGMEAGAEGYFSKKGKSSYLASYRYSIPDIMQKLGIKMNIVPRYQDFTFKTDFDLNEKNKLSVMGIWGKSSIAFIFNDEMLKEYDKNAPGDILTFEQSVKLNSLAYIVGATHTANISPKTDIKTTLSFVRSDTQMLVDTISKGQPNAKYQVLWHEAAVENKYSLNSRMTHRFSYNSRIHSGIKYDLYNFDYLEKSGEPEAKDGFKVINDENGNFSLLRAYLQYQQNLSEKFSITGGVFGMYLTLNKTYSVEPRAGIQYKPATGHTLGLASGMYSQMQPRVFYFLRTYTPNGFEQRNMNLDFTRSAQFDAYYDWAFAPNWHAKIEAYYQHIYNVPVLNDAKEIWTMLEAGGAGDNAIARYEELINKGKGRNYGVEFTLEKFFSHNSYLLFSSTLYRSQYSNGFSDKFWSTVFDGKYLINLAAGYEWELPKNFAIFADIKTSLAGGVRYTPVNKEESEGFNKIILDTTRVNQYKTRDYFRTDLRLGFRWNKKNLMQEMAMDLQNLTNSKNVSGVIYDLKKKDYYEMTLMGFMPMVTYKLQFSF